MPVVDELRILGDRLAGNLLRETEEHAPCLGQDGAIHQLNSANRINRAAPFACNLAPDAERLVDGGRPTVSDLQLSGHEPFLPQGAGPAHRLVQHRRQHPSMQDAREPLEPFAWLVVRQDPIPFTAEGQIQSSFVLPAASKTPLVCGFIIEFVGVLHGLGPVYQRIWRASDVDRRSEALAQLLETALSERFAMPVMQVLQALPIPVAIIEARELRLLAVNDAMASFFHRPDAAGLTITAILPPSHPLSDPRPYRRVAEQGHPFSETILVDGQAWAWFIQPLKGEAETADHCLTGLVAQPAAPLDLDVARLRDMNAAKTEFLNLAAHELRTPLSVIIGYGSLLSQGGLNEEQEKLAGSRVYEKGRRLSRLITDMSLVGRLDELSTGIATERVDLVDLVERIVKDQQRRHPDLAIDLDLKALEAPVQGNASWLHLAVQELLDNAVRFRPTPTGRIGITLSRRGNEVLLSVLDDGFGIHPRHHGQLFKRFARIETPENAHLVGLGIGLYLVQEVARAHAGSIVVQSEPGTGSEFQLKLPASDL